MYLTEEHVLLSGEKYEKEIGALPHTSYCESLYQAIEWMSKDDDEQNDT